MRQQPSRILCKATAIRKSVFPFWNQQIYLSALSAKSPILLKKKCIPLTTAMATALPCVPKAPHRVYALAKNTDCSTTKPKDFGTWGQCFVTSVRKKVVIVSFTSAELRPLEWTARISTLRFYCSAPVFCVNLASPNQSHYN